MLKVGVIDPANKHQLSIDEDGTIGVVVHPHPATDDTNVLPFSQSFTDTGISTGDDDMQVVASLASPSEFWIQASSSRDIFIKTVSIEISDASATLNKFGNITALTNGVEFLHSTNDNGEITINGSLKSNFDFVRLAQGNPSFGDGAGAFRAGNVSGTSEGYIPVIDFSLVFGMPYGIRLRKATNDKLIFKVQDDTTGVDSFTAIGYGIQI